MSKLRYQEFSSRLDIDEMEAELGFEPSGRDGKGNDIGQCPLPFGLHAHGDTTGKFAIHRDKRVYNCWVCGGGSLLDLVMHMKSMNDEEATNWLFQFTKPAEERGEEFMERLHKTMNPNKDMKVTMPYYNDRVLDKWAIDNHQWFEERGISTEVAKWQRLGYADNAVKYAPYKGGQPVDQPYYGPAIILPHFYREQLVGWQHRWLDDDRPKWCQKYTNTNDFPRKETVWGYDVCIKSNEVPVVVESVSTALFLLSLGYPALATFGASVSDEQAKLLRVFQQGIKLAPDAHKLGEEKYWKLAGRLQKYVPVGWINPPPVLQDGEDLGDLVSDPNLVCKSIEEAQYVLSQVPIRREFQAAH